MKDTRALPVALLAMLIAGAAFPQDSSRQTFRTATRLVPVDVVVHDRNGHPVTDLTAADFKLFEDGKEQQIELFSLIGAQGPDRVPVVSGPDPFLRSATNRPERSAALNATVILFDRLNTRFEDQVQARGEIVKFLGQLQPDDRVALYVLDSNTIRVLHDFTADSAALVETIARYRASTSPEQAATDQPVPQPAFIGSAHEDAQLMAWLQEKTEMVAAEYMRLRATTTLVALESISNHLSGIDGRKNLVWVSSGFPLVIGDQFGPRSLTPQMLRAVRAVSSANIAIYPVDTRGLQAPNSTPDATATQAIMPGRRPGATSRARDDGHEQSGAPSTMRASRVCSGITR